MVFFIIRSFFQPVLQVSGVKSFILRKFWQYDSSPGYSGHTLVSAISYLLFTESRIGRSFRPVALSDAVQWLPKRTIKYLNLLPSSSRSCQQLEFFQALINYISKHKKNHRFVFFSSVIHYLSNTKENVKPSSFQECKEAMVFSTDEISFIIEQIRLDEERIKQEKIDHDKKMEQLRKSLGI